VKTLECAAVATEQYRFIKSYDTVARQDGKKRIPLVSESISSTNAADWQRKEKAVVC
jgi:hypothetical protein